MCNLHIYTWKCYDVSVPGAPLATRCAYRRWIAHLDMDAFDAQVELLRYPELAGQTVVIGGERRHQPLLQPDGTRRYATLAGVAGRGVTTAATCPARDLGVHSGMGLTKAAVPAPAAVLLPVDFEQCRHTRAGLRPPWPKWHRLTKTVASTSSTLI